jgi:cell division protein FtsI (penicillin-binding protein 3)
MSIKLTITRRFIFAYFMLLMVAVAVVVQMMNLVMSDMRTTDNEINIRVDTIKANRGDILAHDGRPLVTSALRYTLAIDLRAPGLTDSATVKNKAAKSKAAKNKDEYIPDPFSKRNVDSLAKGLSRILTSQEKTAEKYAQELRNNRHKTMYYQLYPRRSVDYYTWMELKQLPILRNKPNDGGLILIKESRRLYPIEGMARNTVGRINDEGEASGIELYYNRELSGKPGNEIMVRTTPYNKAFDSKSDRETRWIPISSTPQVEPVDGCDIVSTIDVDMQEMAEEVIKKHLHDNDHLEWGTAVIMDVKTGEVRAIANKKKSKDKTSIVEEDNYALRYRKDPGATFKLASFIIMLEKGLKLTDSVDTENGRLTLYRGTPYEKTFFDEGSKGGWLSVQQVFEKSSNVGTVKLMREFYNTRGSLKDYAQRVEALRLKEVVNFDMLHGRRGTSPLIKSVSEFSGITLAQMSIGYELQITPVQTLTLYNAVANNGVMVHPRFIKEIRRQNETVKKFSTQTIHASICSQKTMDKLHQMLLAAVEKGTATRAKSSSFKIAGKTGTAHIAVDSGGYTKQKLSSFAGYFPAESPRYSCIVVFKTYETDNTAFGGAIAAPAFKDIAEKVYARSIDWREPIAEKQLAVNAPECKSGRLGELQRVLDRLSIPLNGNSNSAEWVSAFPQREQVVVNNRSMVRNVVPNVQNMGLQDAIFLLENAGLKVKFSGRGTIRSQSLLPGSPYSRGNVVELALSYNE